MQSINLLFRTGSNCPFKLSKNTVILSGKTHTLTLQLKFNGKDYVILNSELKMTSPVGRPIRYLTENTLKSDAKENDPPGTCFADDNLTSLKTQLSQPLLPNLYISNLFIHAITVALPIKRLCDACIETDLPATRSVASQTPAQLNKTAFP